MMWSLSLICVPMSSCSIYSIRTVVYSYWRRWRNLKSANRFHGTMFYGCFITIYAVDISNAYFGRILTMPFIWDTKREIRKIPVNEVISDVLNQACQCSFILEPQHALLAKMHSYQTIDEWAGEAAARSMGWGSVLTSSAWLTHVVLTRRS